METKNCTQEIAQTLESVKRGNTIVRMMKRFNPQLGTYWVFNTLIVDKITSASVICSDSHKYDKKTGAQKDEDRSVYGSAQYTIMGLAEAKIIHTSLKTNYPSSVRGLEQYFEN